MNAFEKNAFLHYIDSSKLPGRELNGGNNLILSHLFLHRLKRPDTVGTQFRSSLNNLMKILMSKDPSYVRCIKPNELKMASKCPV